MQFEVLTMFKTGNPALNPNALSAVQWSADQATMTVNGAVNKSLLAVMLTTAAAGLTWYQYATTHDPASVAPYMLLGGIGGFIIALITIFKNNIAPITTPLYAVAEGAVLGGMSALFDAQYPGIALRAVGLTLAVLLAMLLAYRTGLVRATEGFKLGVVAATGGIALVYLATLILSFFHINMPFLFGATPFALGFSAFVVIIAALNLVLDFDVIDSSAKQGAPKYMEWYSAMALLITLVWLYMEILRMLYIASQLNRR
jgi:uncharacterized YccA/Bax inhibitor family protein